MDFQSIPNTVTHSQDYSDDAGSFIEHVIGQKTMIWLQSLGASVTLVTTHRFPDRVQAIIAEDPPFLRTKTGVAEDSWILKISIEWATIMRQQPTMAELEVVVAENEMVRDMGADALRDIAERLMRTDSRTLDAATSGEAVREFHPLDSFLKVLCPALLMQADPAAGVLIPDDHMERLLPLPANWTHKRYQDQPHNIHEADPEFTTHEAIDFFTNLAG
jgi:pimeloyl-ACP methyl ester carboxylesterase